MFDALFDGIATALDALYSFSHNYAIAIALLTLGIMIVLTPFTLKGTKSMIQMQRLQPEMKRLQQKYKDDRQKLNEELLAFYKENNLNPLGGCLPMLLQAPVFIILFNVIQGLTKRGPEGTFTPKYLPKTGSELYDALHGSKEMLSFGLDLSQSASTALSESFTTGLPYLLMVGIVAFSAYYQQRQVVGRNPNMEIPAQQKMLMRIFPLMFIAFSYAAPVALVVYFITSNLYRIGQQAYITRSLYHGEDSLGAQAAKASAEAKALREEAGETSFMDRLSGGTRPPAPKPKAVAPQAAAGADRKRPPPATSRTTSPNRSRKKKKRR